MEANQKIISLRSVMAQTSLSRPTIHRRIADGSFPSPIRLSANRIAWISTEIDAWIAARIAESRPEKAGQERDQ